MSTLARRSVLFTFCGLLAAAASAQDSRRVSEPVVPLSCTVLIAAIAAPVANAGKDDTKRIQEALDQCPAGQAVHLSGSNEKQAFLSGPLDLRSGVTLIVDAGVTLYASTNPKDYDRGDHTCGTNDNSGRGCRPFIVGDKISHSAIMGAGSIDGQGGHLIDGRDESWWQIARRAQKESTRQNVPRLLEVSNSRDITLYGITLKNSPNFHVTLNQVDGFTAWGVRIDTPANARNTDGIDPVSSRNITIAHSYIRTGDDNVAIKGGSKGPVENISILHNHFYSGHGMSIGSETNGGVRNILVDDLSLDGTTSGLRIKSNASRGGLVEKVHYQDICLRDVKAPIELDTHYDKVNSGKLIPVYQDIFFEHVHSLTPGKIIMQGYSEQFPIRATMNDVVFDKQSPMQKQFAQIEIADDNPDGSRAGLACDARFVPFPQDPVKNTRPQMSAAQVQAYSIAEVLKYVGKAGNETIDPWNPLADPLAQGTAFKADYVVDAAARADGVVTFNSVQAAVSRAVSDTAGSPRKRWYIQVKPGTYRELVYVPASAIPITLYSEDADATHTKITANLDAATSKENYNAQFTAQFANVDPAIKAMYAQVKDRAALGTYGSMVVWIRNDGFQIRNLTIENAYNKATGNAREECSERSCGKPKVEAQTTLVHHQAVAMMVEGADKVQFENLRLLGFQDTLFLNGREADVTARSFFNRSYVEGDVDFIFGETTAYFYQSEIKSLGDRSVSYVGAPDTNHKTRYGFVFNECRFTHDGSANALAGAFYLARQWFHNERCTPYGAIPVPGYRCTLGATSEYKTPTGTITPTVLETVGKMVVINSRIGAHINKTNPWSDWNKNGTLPYRPAQFSSDDYWTNLRNAGIDPQRQLGYKIQPAPADIYLSEFNNIHE
jgi:polygalacturonase